MIQVVSEREFIRAGHAPCGEKLYFVAKQIERDQRKEKRRDGETEQRGQTPNA
jgi:hypothetical protein